MNIEIFPIAYFEGAAYEWVAEGDGRRLGKLILDNQGTWYAQANNADFERFETGTDEERKAAAIEWLKAR